MTIFLRRILTNSELLGMHVQGTDDRHVWINLCDCFSFDDLWISHLLQQLSQARSKQALHDTS
jgi:hypothetical protein